MTYKALMSPGPASKCQGPRKREAVQSSRGPADGENPAHICLKHLVCAWTARWGHATTYRFHPFTVAAISETLRERLMGMRGRWSPQFITDAVISLPSSAFHPSSLPLPLFLPSPLSLFSSFLFILPPFLVFFSLFSVSSMYLFLLSSLPPPSVCPLLPPPHFPPPFLPTLFFFCCQRATQFLPEWTTLELFQIGGRPVSLMLSLSNFK